MSSDLLPDVCIYDSPGMERLWRALDLEFKNLRHLRNDLFKRFLPDEVALLRSGCPSRIAPHVLQVYRRFDSRMDGATKILLQTQAGLLVESVILRTATGRTTLCLSSQVGCAAACDFCATGKMGIARNLTPAEIVDQVLLAGQLLKEENRTIRNLVFMGMGEPFHNEDNLHQALQLLIDPAYFHHSLKKILVSTVGIPEAMVRCVRRFPAVNLALSLHSVKQEVRECLIPLAKKFPLENLRDAIEQVNRLSQAPVMIEYLMLSAINDSLDDARDVIRWLSGLNVHVNLIPYNPIDEAPHLTGTDRVQREAFANLLKAAGFKTTIRYSLGSDIAAACGQLVRHENRQLAKGP